MKTNLQLQGLIIELKKNKSPIWKRVANDLSKPTRQRRIVNLTKLNRCCKENDIVIVPGKVLGTGELDHKITVAAYDFSQQAVDKLKKSNSKLYTIYDFMKANPEGKKTRIIG